MQNKSYIAKIENISATDTGAIIFLCAKDKKFPIFIDRINADLILSSLNKETFCRPLTHDFILNILSGLNAEISHILIRDTSEGIFYADIVLKMENELGLKIVRIDARPSDCIILAIKNDKKIYVSQKVLDKAKSQNELLDEFDK